MNARLNRLLGAFPKKGIDAFLVSSWPNATYLSGFKGTESWLLVSPTERYFITDSRYEEQARKEARGFRLRLRDKQSVPDIVRDLSAKHRWKRIGFEAQVVTHAFYLQLAKSVGHEKCVPLSDMVETLRELKDGGEIERIRHSARIAVAGFHYIRQIARPGMKERDLQARLEHYTKTLGAEKPAFDIIIATGPRSSMPHCVTNETRVKNNDVLLVDMGVVHEGYHSDLTRPVFLGKMTAFHKKIHGIVRDAQQAGIRKAGPGVAASEVDAACRNFINRKGYGHAFGHGTGHGVGLEIHEAPTVSPKSQTILKAGMVVTVEPGIYLPGRFGIRIEDMVLITKKGHEVLTDGLDRI